MSGIEKFRYDGKRVLVVGGATGMGAAAAKTAAALGAEVVVMDFAPVDFDVAQVVQVDLSDRASIDNAIDQVKGPINAIFSAAGVADGPKVMKINFIGHRHLIERLLAEDRLPRGSAICFISSVAGIGWESDLERVQEFLATPDFEAADAWITAHEADFVNSYPFSKQAINAYVATRAFPFLKKGVRINSICPGPTDTPLAQANADLWLTFAQDYRDATGCEVHTPEQMGDTMVFLCSDAACGISGITLLVDSGHVMSSSTGSFAPGKPMIDLLMGRVSLT
jgi:NAD(P)-dependent dehydrogenase (short-subunit alcohol dehydrogenase family)